MRRATMQIVNYEPKYLEELLIMWRHSFERALSIADPHPLEEQRRYFEREVLTSYRIRLVVRKQSDEVLAFLASNPTKIAQLYVHTDHQRRGIGSQLLEIAKLESSGRLQLFTFARNKQAQAFYLQHGFLEVGRGFEPMWQLEDIEYEWTRPK